MNTMIARLAGALVLAAGVVACRDAPPAPAAPAPPAFGAQGNPTQQTHLVANGDYGYAGGIVTDASGELRGFSLQVWRTGSRADSGAFISYDIGHCDTPLDCVITESGDGPIPRGDLTGSAAGGLHLETNTATNPGVVKDGPGGLIVLDWKRTGDWEVIYRTTQVHRTPGHTWRQQGTMADHSAVASGEAFGFPAAGGYAQLGTNHKTTLDITRETGRLSLLDLAIAPQSGGGLSGAPVAVGDASWVQTQSVSSWDLGSVDWSVADDGGRTSGSLWVRRRPEVGRTELMYNLVRCDASGTCLQEHGYGDIPEGDLSGSGAGGLHLRTNTAGLPGFYNSGAGGVIEIDWRRIALWVDILAGSSTWHYPTWWERRQGREMDVSATASGQVFGVPIPTGAEASVGTDHTVRILREEP